MRLGSMAIGMALVVSLAAGMAAAAEEPGMEITIGKDLPRPTPFIGVGFHAFFPVHAKHTTPQIERLMAERWHDLNPSFARVTHQWNWDTDFAARQIAMMKSCGTSVYLTTWDPPQLDTEAERDAYGRRVADMLNDLVIKRKLDNIHWYCMTNELSLPKEWAAMRNDLPLFEDYHRRIFKAMREQELDVSLLATDASPTAFWNTIRWAMEHMDDVTGAYGGHHYINDHKPDHPAFYGWFEAQVRGVATAAHAKQKPFVIGEFGPKQHRGERYGFKRWDGCAYFDTPEEPMAALQTTEAVIAAVNGGADAIAYWTFADFPDDYVANKAYANKWGTFRWDGKDFGRRSVYYAIGLLTHFFRGPATVCEVSAPTDVRAMAIRDKATGRMRVALLSRRAEPTKVRLSVAGLDASAKWQAWVFNPKEAKSYVAAGDLLNAKNRLAAVDADHVTIPAQSLIVLVQQE